MLQLLIKPIQLSTAVLKVCPFCFIGSTSEHHATDASVDFLPSV